MNLTEQKKRRLVLALLFGGVALLAILLALGTNHFIARALLLPKNAVLTHLGTPVIPAAGTASTTPSNNLGRSSRSGFPGKRTYVKPIVNRSIFDSSKVGTETTGQEIGDVDNKSDLKVVLLATLVAEPSEFSSALIAEERSDEAAKGYGIGDILMDEAEIMRIEQRRIVIKRDDGTEEYIGMEDDNGSSRLSQSSDDEDEEGGVEKISENKFIVDQALVDQILENPEKLYSKIRVVPHKGADGEIDGYRLSGIRRKSFFSKLGMKNGDIVHSVNGRDLTSLSSAMEAYSSMQSDTDFNFDITRRSQKQTFEYEIR